MYVQQLYTNCLAEAAYYIESNGEAAVIDPIRETEGYIELAEKRGAKIKYVFETHFHADFVSGHIDLAQKTGAKIIYGPMAETAYRVHNAKDGEEFTLGAGCIRAIHTPGHTPESTCYLLLDENGREYCIFTGDTLFVGDVGRPDLLDGKMSKEELASMMYDSMQKLKKIPDDVIVYPAHGPGSSCGKNLGKETWSTIRQQKDSNYAMKDKSREQFIQEVTDGLTPPPAYFFSDAKINKMGYQPLEKVMTKNKQSLTVPEVESMIANGAMVLDTRNPDDFEKGFIPGAINIGLNGTFAVWVGTVIDINKDLIIVAPEGKEEESILRLARVGYERVLGFLEGGIESWIAAGKNTNTVKSIEPFQFADIVAGGNANVLDVRKLSEAEAGHVKNAAIIPLADLNQQFSSIPKNKTVYIHCAGGYRSMIASSMLKAQGYENIVNVHEGWSKIKTTDIPIATGLPETTG